MVQELVLILSERSCFLAFEKLDELGLSHSEAIGTGMSCLGDCVHVVRVVGFVGQLEFRISAEKHVCFCGEGVLEKDAKLGCFLSEMESFLVPFSVIFLEILLV